MYRIPITREMTGYCGISGSICAWNDGKSLAAHARSSDQQKLAQRLGNSSQ